MTFSNLRTVCKFFLSVVEERISRTPISLRTWWALYALAMAVGLMLLRTWMSHDAALTAQLMPAYQNPTFRPNFALLNFVTMVAFGAGCMALSWLHGMITPTFRTARFLSNMALIFSLYGLVMVHTHLSGIFMVVAFLLALSCLVGRKVSSIPGILPVVSVGRDVLGNMLQAVPVLVAVTVLATAWYPITLPNDYYELPVWMHTDAVFSSADHMPPTIRRREAINCMVGGGDCVLGEHFQALPQAKSTLQAIGGWEAQAGRTLFHHSYIFVPANHMLHYGVTSDVPTLYGLGNTLFFAGMMKYFGSDLGHYFQEYFASLLIGFACIAAMVFAITRSWLALASAMMLVIGCFFGVTYTATVMAAGFTPMRYLGLLLQAGSILLAFRLTGARGVLVLLASLAFSVLWNREFAAIGFAGQALVLLSPHIRLSWLARAVSLALLTGTLIAIFAVLSIQNPHLLFSNQYGFFGIGMPAVSARIYYKLLMGVFFVSILAAWGARQFPPAAAHARLCLMPVLALLMVKYIFNLSPVHLFYSLVFICPLLLIYFPGWKSADRQSVMLGRTGIYLLSFALLFHTGLQYNAESKTFRSLFVTPMVSAPWTGLHDTVQSTLADPPIARRVEAIKDVMKPDDTMLMLSPFDHLLNFYVAPRYFCGHFELLTSLVTQEQMSQVTNCALEKPGTLVIYDKALVKPECSRSDADNNYLDWASCWSKWQLKQALVLLRDRLLPNLRVVKETDELIIYRTEPSPHASAR